MKKKLLNAFLAFLFLSVQVMAQQKTITGKVTSADDGNALPGVSIKIKGSSEGTITDVNGSYTIKAAQGEVLVFSFISFATQEVTVKNTGTINVKLGADTKSLNEVVVVGYGTQKRANLTGAVATVDTKVLQSRPITDVARGLQGVVPGLTITTATGDLGTDPKIRLRGLVGSINTGAAGAAPLILVDNVEIPSLQLVNPDDIESISVLKDAASASIYGTRAAFGVILVTTKTGKRNGTNRITYSNNFAWSAPTNQLKLASAADNSQASLLALQRFNPNTSSYSIIGYSVDAASIQKMRDWETQYGGQNLGPEMVQGRDFDIIGGKLYFYRSWDAGKMYLKDWTPQQSHNVGISGGSEKINYNLGLGYLGQKGVLKVNPDEFDRYNFSLGVGASPTKWLDARGKVIFANTVTKTPFIFSGSQYGPYYYLYRWPANYPYGTYNGLPFRSAVTEVQQAKLDEDKNNLTRISVGGTFKILPGFTVDADYTYSGTNEHFHQTGGNTSAYDFWSFNGTALNYTPYQSASYNKARYYSYWNTVSTGKLFATYNKNIKDHSFKAILGSDIELNQYTSQSSERRNLLDPNFGEVNLATGDQFATSSDGHYSTLGYFGRINYAYKDKYLLELNGRVDGSSRFPVKDLYGFFPSASAGYVLTKEPYMDWSKGFLSFLKIRGSYGSVGNQAVGNYRFLSLLSAQTSGWLLPSGNAVTLTTPTPLSPILTWETIRTADLGLDARFLNDELGLTFDVFNRTTSNMISAGIPLPSSFGASSPVRNYGELQGKGWELAIDYNHTFSGGFHFSATATLSDAQETITKFASPTRQLPAPIAALNSNYYEGMKLGEIWGYVSDRLFTASDFAGKDAAGHYIYAQGVPSQTQMESGSFYFGPGDVKYKDLNGDGVVYQGSNTVDDHGDKKIIGNSTPRYQYGLRLGGDWKGFDLNVYFQGVGKRQLWASGPVVFPGFRAAEGWYSYQMNYWTESNPNAFYPRPTDYGSTVDRWDYQPQTRYLLNMAYLRLKNLNLGYSFSRGVTKKLGIERLRLFFSGENILTFDHLGDIPVDPETDFSQTQIDNDRAGFGRVYPYRKTYSLGLQVTF
ncbi:SusC/RagA family TonB-linked outer membrane protein [Mucilaginibacter pocheonensis]|uniref:TonB-linked SusC/RagA family outer membrane protein n=1 Tax=Mucilaginibacter pocheonensis TaxID=398050 RepID=A0ABU1T6W0_9SPHI|nr:TonB-dependent receptor [Mucilaginibacter pocheonensis]MDR6940940.1 TonB-linked SusC/RagA family outer membrane protein [Mucilaginibacter pocheonensis]